MATTTVTSPAGLPALFRTLVAYFGFRHVSRTITSWLDAVWQAKSVAKLRRRQQVNVNPIHPLRIVVKGDGKHEVYTHSRLHSNRFDYYDAGEQVAVFGNHVSGSLVHEWCRQFSAGLVENVDGNRFEYDTRPQISGGSVIPGVL